ncbi:MAG: vitamin B12 dependent-methionine synthase activation domain-containing protein [Bacteroidales bacterium]|nr:vitamin B12 dependent-methionine synthase activation domain-containing protein [Bacteroidales bacterium]MDD3431530.1 vitamin B12 dependent-methionine synthase activation domain-containing protein [Bacteroidales bacterium]MDD4361963.1 vitamin B12 dependent-methionine synthase activation domain-containing protein [Bacteroidales bacterium]MDD4430306.1 vitamin B12 dependent-methionine synthase activation domain-containing protein [Bacteroidales bacterium]
MKERREYDFKAGGFEITIWKYEYTARELELSMADFKEKLPAGRNETEDFAQDIEQVIADASASIQAKAAYRLPAQISLIGEILQLDGRDFRIGDSLSKKLTKTEQLAVFVCTAGEQIGELYRAYSEQGDSLKAFFADLLGTIAVEKTLELLYKELEKEFLNDGLHAARAISPGDCGWPLTEQAELFSLLPGNCCGIRLNQSMLMQPQKSLSGIIPMGKNLKRQGHQCSNCSSVHCPYRK